MNTRERWDSLSTRQKSVTFVAMGALAFGYATDVYDLQSPVTSADTVDTVMSLETLNELQWVTHDYRPEVIRDLLQFSNDSYISASATQDNSYGGAAAEGEMYYVAPEPRGDGTGVSRENAADWNGTNELPDLGAGDVVNFLTDGEDVYSFTGKDEHSGIVFTVSGDAGAPITFRGIGASDTEPACAVFESNRSDPYAPPGKPGPDGDSIGGNLFTIMQGANNLAFQNMCPKNIGNVFTIHESAELINTGDSGDPIVDERRITDDQLTEIVTEQPHPIYISGFEATNVRRFYDMESGARSANVLLEDVSVAGHSKNAIRLRGAASTMIRRVAIDGGGQDGDNFQAGVVLQGDSPQEANSDTLITDARITHMCGTSDKYWQGDSISDEEHDKGTRVEKSKLSDTEDSDVPGACDANGDFKGEDPVVAHSELSAGNRVLRKHPGATNTPLRVYNSILKNAQSNPGKGGSAILWATGQIEVYDSTIIVDQDGTDALIKAENGKGKKGSITVARTTIQNSLNVPCKSKESGSKITFIDADCD